jgi:acyl-CoA thioesterase-2
MTMPDVPAPESLPTTEERLAPVKDKLHPEVWKWITRERPIDTRSVTDHNPFQPVAREARQLVWIRASGRLPDDPLLHQTVVAYASDLMLLDTATLPHAIAWNDPNYVMASLDHALWFHRGFRADEWLLYAQESPAAHGARGFTLGHFFTRNGTVVASVAQEGLVRPVRKRTPA